MADNLKKLIGCEIVIVSSQVFIGSGRSQIIAKLRGVQPAGIWIESQHLTDSILDDIKQKMVESTPIFFLPFSSILYLIAFSDSPAISSHILE